MHDGDQSCNDKQKTKIETKRYSSPQKTINEDNYLMTQIKINLRYKKIRG
jgi:hypothetical protein